MRSLGPVCSGQQRQCSCRHPTSSAPSACLPRLGTLRHGRRGRHPLGRLRPGSAARPQPRQRQQQHGLRSKGQADGAVSAGSSCSRLLSVGTESGAPQGTPGARPTYPRSRAGQPGEAAIRRPARGRRRPQLLLQQPGNVGGCATCASSCQNGGVDRIAAHLGWAPSCGGGRVAAAPWGQGGRRQALGACQAAGQHGATAQAAAQALLLLGQCQGSRHGQGRLQASGSRLRVTIGLPGGLRDATEAARPSGARSPLAFGRSLRLWAGAAQLRARCGDRGTPTHGEGGSQSKRAAACCGSLQDGGCSPLRGRLNVLCTSEERTAAADFKRSSPIASPPPLAPALRRPSQQHCASCLPCATSSF